MPAGEEAPVLMSDPNNPLIAALLPLVRRVRTDVTAVRSRTARGGHRNP